MSSVSPARANAFMLFFRRFSISWRFALLLILFSIFVGGVVTVFYLGLKQVLDHNVQAAQNIMIEGQKEKLAVASNSMALSIAEAIKEEKDPAARIELIRKMVDPIRFEQDKSGYYFVYENTVNVALPTKKDAQGKDLGDTKDKNNVYFVRDLMTKAKDGGGFVEYVFPKPGQGDQPKLAYSTMIPGTTMWIGTGVYIDNIEKEKANIRLQSEERIRSILTQIFTGIGVCLVLIILLSGLIISTISGPIREATSAAMRCADGDLDIKLDALGSDEAARMQAALNKMVETLRANIRDIEAKTQEAQDKALAADAARLQAEEAMDKAEKARCDGMAQAASRLEAVVQHIGSATQSISHQADDINTRAGEQSERIGVTATNMDQMSDAVMDVARNASSASVQAEQARQKAIEGRKVVDDSIQAMRQVGGEARSLKSNMDDLGKRSQDINRILTVISDIADQTNLLALNAAIEAARAGDAGRGFAVVADEVRKLAEKTMTATQEVTSSITAIQKSAQDSISNTDRAIDTIELAGQLADKSGALLNELVAGAQTSAEQIQTIAAAAEEQSAASEEINRSLESVSELTSQTLGSVENAADAIKGLLGQANELRRIIDELKVEAGCHMPALGA
ncbi:methyl-accepting chemotaxis protein [Fundidesulfovibrio terrae]|uniref:methyl-accepting chemotaxis protein n=1 Tax=Fundidesulfovibrio terrae TaxID=2922866 RepID=UPI001FAFC692|nr:methyl-accepting chemotaxis protein [Fundidesulfovibrio terrae]